MHGETDPQARTGKDRRRFVDDLAERLGGARAMGRAEGCQGESAREVLAQVRPSVMQIKSFLVRILRKPRTEPDSR
jgi:hypothetical protein